MIARGGKENFFAAHYDWIAACVGALAFVGAVAFFVLVSGEDADAAASAEARAIDMKRPAELGVKAQDMSAFDAVTRLLKSPVTVNEVSEKDESFLASERRVKCKCGRVISGDVRKFPECPYCHEKQEVEKAVVLDADNDGLPDEWEKKHGLNPGDAADAQADADGDGFTNLEEFLAKTDPTDRRDHPEYTASLTLTLPLKETYIPFVLRQAMPIGKSWRCEFFHPKRKDNYGRMGATITAKIDEEIADTGYIVRGYEKKTAKQAIKGAKGLTRAVDVSEAVLERKTDGKRVTLVTQQGKGVRLTPVDVQATLVYERGGTKTFTVVPGDEIDLNGEKYKVEEVVSVGKGGKVTLAKLPSGKKYVVALEQ